MKKLQFDIGKIAFNLSRSFKSSTVDVFAFSEFFIEEETIAIMNKGSSIWYLPFVMVGLWLIICQ